MNIRHFSFRRKKKINFIRYWSYRTALCMIILLCFSLNAHAAIYYVDQSAGKDSNNGISPGTAWKNSPGMNEYSGSGRLRPGDTVYFDSADTWKGSGTSVINAVGGVSYIGDAWGSGTRAKFQASGECSTGIINIMDDDTVHETAFKGFEIDGKGNVTSGVAINYGPGKTRRLTGATKRIENCVVHDCGCNQNLGQYHYGIIVSDDSGLYYVENVALIDNTVYNICRDGICLYPPWNCTSCQVGKATVRGNEVYNTGTDPNYDYGSGIILKGNVYDVVVEDNYVHDVDGTGLMIDSEADVSGQTNITVRHNIITAPGHGGQNQDCLLIGLYGNKDIDIYGNIFMNPTAYAVEIKTEESDDTVSIRFFNNTIYNGQTYIGYIGQTSELSFKNNIFFYTGGIPFRDLNGNTSSHAGNIYYRGGSTLVYSNGFGYNTGNLVSYESSAYSSDPDFVNTNNLPSGFTGLYGKNSAPNTDGLNLRSGSNGIDNGVSLSSSFSRSINSVVRPVGNGWDIGAYEQPLPAPSNLMIPEKY